MVCIVYSQESPVLLQISGHIEWKPQMENFVNTAYAEYVDASGNTYSQIIWIALWVFSIRRRHYPSYL